MTTEYAPKFLTPGERVTITGVSERIEVIAEDDPKLIEFVDAYSAWLNTTTIVAMSSIREEAKREVDKAFRALPLRVRNQLTNRPIGR